MLASTWGKQLAVVHGPLAFWWFVVAWWSVVWWWLPGGFLVVSGCCLGSILVVVVVLRHYLGVCAGTSCFLPSCPRGSSHRNHVRDLGPLFLASSSAAQGLRLCGDEGSEAQAPPSLAAQSRAFPALEARSPVRLQLLQAFPSGLALCSRLSVRS